MAFNKNENKNVLRTEFRNLSSFLPFILLSDWKRLNCIKACYKNWANIVLLSLYMFDRLYDIICWVRVITFATVRTSLAVESMFQLSLDTYTHEDKYSEQLRYIFWRKPAWDTLSCFNTIKLEMGNSHW